MLNMALTFLVIGLVAAAGIHHNRRRVVRDRQISGGTVSAGVSRVSRPRNPRGKKILS